MRRVCVLFNRSSLSFETAFLKAYTWLCVNISGICECETGYSGETCNISASTKPTVADVPYFCDISQTTDCKMAVIYGNNFVQSDNLKCHYALIQVRYGLHCEKCYRWSLIPRKVHTVLCYRVQPEYRNYACSKNS